MNVKNKRLNKQKISIIASALLCASLSADVVVSSPTATTQIFDGANENLIVNSGTDMINVSDSGQVYGANAIVLSETQSITINGDVKAYSDSSSRPSDWAVGVKVDNAVDGSITNNATVSGITLSNTNVAGVGIYVGSVGASGSIVNSVGASIYGESAYIHDTSSPTVSGTGIYVETFNEGNVVNNGTIEAVGETGNAYGIHVETNIVDGTIINGVDGLISANGYFSIGVNAVNNFSLIQNLGVIVGNDANVTNALDSVGVKVTSNQASGIIENLGDITIYGGVYSASGMFVTENNGQITNNGNVSVNGESPVGIMVLDNNGVILNDEDGVITTYSDTEEAVGILSRDDAFDAGGLIINDGNIEVLTNASATGIFTSSDSIINNNNISVSTNTDGSVDGVYVSALAGFFENNGDIISSGLTYDGYASGARFAELYDANITNNGSIITNSNTYSSALIIEDGDDSGLIINDGLLQGTIGLQKDANGFSLMNLSGASVTNGIDGIMIGNIVSLGTLHNNGLISLPYDTYADDGVAYIDTLVNSGTGILEIELNADSGGVVYSQLETNDATFEDGSTIRVVPTSLTTQENANLLIGTILNDIVVADNNLTILGTLNIESTALLDFAYIEDGETIDLNVTQAKEVASVFNGFSSASKNKNGRFAGEAIDRIVNGGNSGINGFVNNLLLLPTDEAVAQAVESTTSQTTTSSYLNSMQIAYDAQGFVDMRQKANIGINSGDTLFNDRNVWIKPYYSHSVQSDYEGVRGFTSNTIGFGVGADGEYANNSKIGLALFYAQGSLDVDGLMQSSDSDTYTALIYGNNPLFSNKTNLFYQLGYSVQDNSSEREVAFSGVAKADYETSILMASAKATHDIDSGLGVLLQPLVKVSYRNFNSDAYSESGATNGMNLNIGSFEVSQLIGSVGLEATYGVTEKTELLISGEVGYDFLNEIPIVSSSYEGAVGTSFDTYGIDNGAVSYALNVEYEIKELLGGDITLGYNYVAEGATYKNSVYSLKYSYLF